MRGVAAPAWIARSHVRVRGAERLAHVGVQRVECFDPTTMSLVRFLTLCFRCAESLDSHSAMSFYLFPVLCVQ